MIALRWILRYWRELALLVAGVALYALGSCARSRGLAVAAWQDSVRVAHEHAAEAVAAYQAADHATTAAAVDLDSARAAWRRALPRVRPDTVPSPAQIIHQVDTLRLAGERLDRTCTAYQSRCEQLQAQARATIDSLQRETRLLARRPPDPAARRLQPSAALLYDPVHRELAGRAGAELRIAGDWRLTADLSRRLFQHDTTRLYVGIRRTF